MVLLDDGSRLRVCFSREPMLSADLDESFCSLPKSYLTNYLPFLELIWPLARFPGTGRLKRKDSDGLGIKPGGGNAILVLGGV